jgi:hypothetical protein
MVGGRYCVTGDELATIEITSFGLVTLKRR